jgi:hypothetical protein
MKTFCVLLIFGISISLSAQEALPPHKPSANADLKAMVDEDQRVRTDSDSHLTKEERMAIFRAGADRRIAVKRMIAANQLGTGVDYFNAALILQHSMTADDYLLAHTLAVIAVSKGDKDAIWLSSATLDRYLMAISQPQIYGTQYRHSDQTKPWTQAPYAPDLISDALRNELGVLSLAEQKKQLNSYNEPQAVK